MTGYGATPTSATATPPPSAQAAAEANARGEHVMQYNARKQQVIREIYHRAFVAAGLLEPSDRGWEDT